MNAEQQTRGKLIAQVAEREDHDRRVRAALGRPRAWEGHAYDDSLPEVWFSGRAAIIILVIGVLVGVGLTLFVDPGAVAYWVGRWK